MNQQKQQVEKQEIQPANKPKARIEDLPVDGAPGDQAAQIKGGSGEVQTITVTGTSGTFNTPHRP